MSQLRLGEERLSLAKALKEAAAADLAAAAPDYLQRFPLEPYIAELEHHGRPHRFYEFTPRALEINREMHAAYPDTAVELYNRMLLAHCIVRSEAHKGHIIISTIHPYILEDFDRILKALGRPRAGYYKRDNHLFRRDLAIARLKVLPNGFEFYDLDACIARREMLKGGVRGLFRYAAAFRTGLLAPLYPLYEPHWDRRYVRYFSAEEYERCCLRMADMLAVNPSVRAVVSPSWWYDPQLKPISPELWFVREIAEAGGARFMLISSPSPVIISDALAFSPLRKSLHAQGKYNPRGYLMVWPRKAMIAWAKRTRQEKPDLESRGVPCSVA